MRLFQILPPRPTHECCPLWMKRDFFWGSNKQNDNRGVLSSRQSSPPPQKKTSDGRRGVWSYTTLNSVHVRIYLGESSENETAGRARKRWGVNNLHESPVGFRGEEGCADERVVECLPSTSVGWLRPPDINIQPVFAAPESGQI